VIDALRERLRAQRASGASMMVRRILLMAEPPSIDANEIADKGYVNQAACRTRRAHLIGELYEASPAAHIGCA
jgi:feruloyl-CoA synthase